VARRYRALPIGYEDSRLLVAMADPANLFALDDIRTITGMDLQPVVATAADIEVAIRKYSRMDESVQKLSSEAASAVEDDMAEMERAAASLEEGPIVKMVNLLISQAIADRASDIHIEPMEREVRIRYRIDGVLQEVMRSPKNIQAGLISRLKVMADINIAERRVPQDGRIGLTVGGKSVDLRVATLPTVYGEKVSSESWTRARSCSSWRSWDSWTSRSSASRRPIPSPTGPSSSPDPRVRGSRPPCTPP
jgi:type IV pilus assembly protein PilB